MVIEPPVRPTPVATEVTVPVLLVLLFHVYFSPVVTRDTSVPPEAAALLEYVVFCQATFTERYPLLSGSIASGLDAVGVVAAAAHVETVSPFLSLVLNVVDDNTIPVPAE